MPEAHLGEGPIWARGRSLPSAAPRVGFVLHRRRLAAIRFLFPQLGCLRRHSGRGAKPEQSVQLVPVIHLRCFLRPGVPSTSAALSHAGDLLTFRPLGGRPWEGCFASLPAGTAAKARK